MNSIRAWMSPRDWLDLSLLAVLWAGSFLFVGLAVRDLPPLTIVMLRVGLAAAALHLIARARGLSRGPAPWRHFLVMGALNNAIPFTLFAWSQGHIASGLAAILNATTPLLTLIVAHVWTRDEKLSGARVAGIVCGVVGVAVMVGPAAWRGLGIDLAAQLACLAAALSYAFAGVYGLRLAAAGIAPLQAAAGQTTAASFLILPLVMVFDQPWRLPWPAPETAGAIMGLAVLSTACAYVLYFRILAGAGATNLLLVTLLIPIGAIGFGHLILNEPIVGRHLFGALIICSGLIVSQWRLRPGIGHQGKTSH